MMIRLALVLLLSLACCGCGVTIKHYPPSKTQTTAEILNIKTSVVVKTIEDIHEVRDNPFNNQFQFLQLDVDRGTIVMVYTCSQQFFKWQWKTVQLMPNRGRRR